MNKRIALLDLDTPVFKAAAVSEHKSVLVTHERTGIQKSFSNRTEFKNTLKEKGKLDRVDEYSITDVQEPEPIENALHILNTHVDNIIESIWPDEVIFMISGKSNFRNDLPLPTRYKSNRTSARPLLLKQVQKYAWKKYNALIPDNCECDDMQVYMGYDILKQGDTPIIVSTDKDSKAYSGLHLYNPDHPDDGVIEIPDLGNIGIDSSGKVRATGMLQYGLQQLIGDAIDGFKPTELCNVRFGEISALNLLEHCKTEKEVLEVIVQKYKEWYPEDFTYTAWNGKTIESNWQHMLNLYFSCCRMKGTKDDPLIAFDFYKRHGVNLND